MSTLKLSINYQSIINKLKKRVHTNLNRSQTLLIKWIHDTLHIKFLFYIIAQVLGYIFIIFINFIKL